MRTTELKAVSEIVASLLLFAIGLVAATIVVTGLYEYYSGRVGLIPLMASSGEHALKEAIDVVYAAVVNGNLTVLVYNYGDSDAKLGYVIVDGVVYVAEEVANTTSLPRGELTVISISVQLSSGVHRVTVQTLGGVKDTIVIEV